jgi:cyclopropane-fatty-acyl-phospholipid synthase
MVAKLYFPGGYCPALSETLSALEPSKLLVTDIEFLHHHYAETLHRWQKNFLQHYKEIESMLGERFCRMWEFYLAGCEIAFRLRGYTVFSNANG